MKAYALPKFNNRVQKLIDSNGYSVFRNSKNAIILGKTTRESYPTSYIFRINFETKTVERINIRIHSYGYKDITISTTPEELQMILKIEQNLSLLLLNGKIGEKKVEVSDEC